MDELLREFDQLIEYIKLSDCYLTYQKWKTLVGKDAELLEIIEKVKKTQKNLVQQTYQGMDTTPLKEDLEKLNQKLNVHPIYQNYLITLEELNQMMEKIKYQIEAILDQKNKEIL